MKKTSMKIIEDTPIQHAPKEIIKQETVLNESISSKILGIFEFEDLLLLFILFVLLQENVEDDFLIIMIIILLITK